MDGFEIRDRTVNRGSRPLTRERRLYLQLMEQGVGNREACRIVGVNYRTGKRWRNGRTASAGTPRAVPLTAAPPETSCGRYLSQDERILIADRLREKAGVRTIAAELGRSPSTVSREIRRNRTSVHGGKHYYRPYAAQRSSDLRRPRPKQAKIRTAPRLRAFVQQHLDKKWSPEQICQALRTSFPDRPAMHVVHETIYQALYVPGRGGLRRELTHALRTGRPMRRPRRVAQRRRPRMSSPMVMISERPAEVADRAVHGHWEGDLIVGKYNGSAIATLVERSTRYVKLVRLSQGRGAEQVARDLADCVRTLPRHLMRSLTWDQGPEMSAHGTFTVSTGVPVYFCDPASPWQRGSNENTNGLLRQYFPKGTDLSLHSHERLAAVATELNGRPRKTLGWDTPAERLARLLSAAE